MRRREFIAALGGAAAWPMRAWAQQSSGLRRIGILQGIGDDPQTLARNRPFLEKLQELGWTDGVNVKIEMRSSSAGDVDSASKYAAELVSLAPNVLVTFGSSSVAALQRVTRSIPIVFANVVDPVGAGFVATLARPGGNTTGFTAFEYSLSGKLLELLKEIAPGVTRVAVLRDPTLAAGIGQYAVIQAMASPSRVELSVIDMRDAGEIDRALGSFAHEPNGGLIVAVSATAVELTSSIVPRGTSFHRSVELEFPSIAFDLVRLSCRCGLPGPPELGAVNPYAVHDHSQPACQGHDRLFHPAAPGDLHRPGFEPAPFLRPQHALSCFVEHDPHHLISAA